MKHQHVHKCTTILTIIPVQSLYLVFRPFTTEISFMKFHKDSLLLANLKLKMPFFDIVKIKTSIRTEFSIHIRHTTLLFMSRMTGTTLDAKIPIAKIPIAKIAVEKGLTLRFPAKKKSRKFQSPSQLINFWDDFIFPDTYYITNSRNVEIACVVELKNGFSWVITY